MQSGDVLRFIEFVDSMKETLGGCIAELGELSPEEIEIRLGVAMKDTKTSERLSALLKYLDEQSDLRLQVRFEHKTLVFGTFWLQGETRLLSIECPAALAYYIEVPAGRSINPQFERQFRGALEALAFQLGIKVEEVLRLGGAMMLSRHHAAIEALMGDPSARQRNQSSLEALKAKGVFWQESLRVLEGAREEQQAAV